MNVSRESAAKVWVRNRAIIASAKNVPCADCGGDFPSWVMQFDHVGSDKLRNVAGMSTYSVQKLMSEIEKCEVVCANCHADRTYWNNKG